MQIVTNQSNTLRLVSLNEPADAPPRVVRAHPKRKTVSQEKQRKRAARAEAKTANFQKPVRGSPLDEETSLTDRGDTGR
jgi:hypothetical protein